MVRNEVRPFEPGRGAEFVGNDGHEVDQRALARGQGRVGPFLSEHLGHARRSQELLVRTELRLHPPEGAGPRRRGGYGAGHAGTGIIRHQVPCRVYLVPLGFDNQIGPVVVVDLLLDVLVDGPCRDAVEHPDGEREDDEDHEEFLGPSGSPDVEDCRICLRFPGFPPQHEDEPDENGEEPEGEEAGTEDEEDGYAEEQRIDRETASRDAGDFEDFLLVPVAVESVDGEGDEEDVEEEPLPERLLLFADHRPFVFYDGGARVYEERGEHCQNEDHQPDEGVEVGL